MREKHGSKAAPFWSVMVAGFAHAVLMGLSFPPIGLWPMALVSLVPLAWAASRGRERALRSGIAAWIGVAPFWVLQQHWLVEVTEVGTPLLVVYLSAYAGLFVAVSGWVMRRGGRLAGSVVMGVVWTGLEVARGELVMTGYPWFLAAHPLVEVPALATPASLLGTYFVSFLVATLAGAAADASGWTGVRRRMGGVGALAVAVAWVVSGVIGTMIGGVGEVRRVRVGVVQTNLPQSNKLGWTIEDKLTSWERFADLTRQAARASPAPEVILWPETMFPGRALNGEAVAFERESGLGWIVGRDESGGRGGGQRVPLDYFAIALEALSAEVGVPMLVGATALEGLSVREGEGGVGLEAERTFNSVFVVERGAVKAERYDKLELTPFGEVIPYLSAWPWLEERVLVVGAPTVRFDLAAGRSATVLSVELGAAAVGGVPGTAADGVPDPRVDAIDKDLRDSVLRVATPICFEATKSGLCRRLVFERGGEGAGGGGSGGGVRRRASLMVNVSNDGWFGGWDAGREQHLLSARWRCVETRTPMVRAVNTGLSAIIDATGRVTVVSPARTAMVLTGEVEAQVGDCVTGFARAGNWFGWVMLGGTGLLALGAGAIGSIVGRTRPFARR